MNYDLNASNLDILTIKMYHGKFWTKEELENDLKRVKYIKRLMGKYVRRKDLNERLILNHIIILGNVFGPEFTTKLLFYSINKEYYYILKTFLLYLDYLPDFINTINGQTIDTRLINIDLELAKRLRNV